MLVVIKTTVHIVLQVMHIKRIEWFQMVDVYILLSKIQLNTSRVLLLNQIIFFISIVLWGFVMSVLITTLPTKNYMMDQIIH